MTKTLSLPRLLLAALAWLHVFGVLWAVMLGYVSPGWDVAGVWLFGFIVALGAMAGRKAENT